MHRRTVMKVCFVLFTAFLSIFSYNIYMSLDSLGRAALVESGDTTYYPPIDRFDVAFWSVVVASVATLIFMAIIMFAFYLLMFYSAYSGVEHAKMICEGMDCVDPTIYKDVHWYGYEWSVLAVMPSGETYESCDKDGLFNDFKMVYN